MRNFNMNCILNSILCNCNVKMPLSNNHYITGKDLLLFKNLTCIEQGLTSITCGIKNGCSNIRKLAK